MKQGQPVHTGPSKRHIHMNVFCGPELLLYRLAMRMNKLRLFYRLYEVTRTRFPGIARFKDIHRGSRCFIMGGGPSLKKIDPRLLKDEITFGVNGIFLIYDWLGFQPTYYVVEDVLVYEDRAADIVERVVDSECFFPIQFSCPGFDRVNHHYFRALYEFSKAAGFPRFSDDPSKLMWIGGTVTFICMQLAYYMGFERVYLVGMDHNYVRPSHVTAEGNTWTSNGEDPNHFHPDYFGKGYRWHDPRVDRMEQAYHCARRAFEADGRHILNATAGGALEVFERVAFESLFPTEDSESGNCPAKPDAFPTTQSVL